MSKIFKSTSFWCLISVIAAYGAAELVIRCDALNQISFGIAGWILAGGIAFLAVKFILIPVFSFTTFPQWVEPESMSDLKEEYQKLSLYAEWLLKQYGSSVPEALQPLMTQLKLASAQKNDPARYREDLRKILPEIHKKLSTEVCGDIIKKYMKRTAVMVCISQRGWLDSLVMLIMQIRLVVDLAKALGYRPNWRLMLSCTIWIVSNSILFSLFDESMAFEEISKEILPLAVGENVTGAFLGKLLSGALQAVTSMAILYSTGKIIEKQLLEGQKNLTGQERISYRIEGYKTAWQQMFAVAKVAINKGK